MEIYMEFYNKHKIIIWWFRGVRGWLGWGHHGEEGAAHPPVDGAVAAAMQPSDISVASEPDDDACLTPTQRAQKLTAQKKKQKISQKIQTA